MTNSMPLPALLGEESDLTCYTSFVLRCWLTGEGHIHARLIDVHSGRSYPLADLADLPERIRCLVAPAQGRKIPLDE